MQNSLSPLPSALWTCILHNQVALNYPRWFQCFIPPAKHFQKTATPQEVHQTKRRNRYLIQRQCRCHTHPTLLNLLDLAFFVSFPVSRVLLVFLCFLSCKAAGARPLRLALVAVSLSFSLSILLCLPGSAAPPPPPPPPLPPSLPPLPSLPPSLPLSPSLPPSFRAFCLSFSHFLSLSKPAS